LVLTIKKTFHLPKSLFLKAYTNRACARFVYAFRPLFEFIIQPWCESRGFGQQAQLTLPGKPIQVYNQAMTTSQVQFQYKHSHLTRGYTVAVISAVFLSTTAIFIRYLTQTYNVPSLVLAFWRDVFVVLTLLVALGWHNSQLLRVNRKHLTYLVGYGLVLAIFNAMWTLSVALNGAAVATVLAYCSTAFTALLGWWLLKERLNWAKLLAVSLCLGGCVLVSEAIDPAAWRTNTVGILTGVLSGLCYAIYSLMGRSASQQGLNPWTTLVYTFGFAAAFLLATNLIPANPIPGVAVRAGDLFWLGDAWVGWGVLFLLAAVPTVMGFGLYNISLSYLPSSVANLIVTLEPVFTAITAYFLLGERLTWIQILGSMVVLAGVVFFRVYEGRLAVLSARSQAAIGPTPAE
jgi:drug/metabolite transporter (DMT)-like permease